MLKLSIVVTVFNEEENIKPLVKNIFDSLDGYDYEIIYVDDGSTDNTVREVKSLNSKKIKLIEFRKNFGQSSALAAGIDNAEGEYIVKVKKKEGNYLIPFNAVIAIGDFMVIAEEDIISHTFPIRRKAMERVLKGEVCDYNFFLRITFHNKDNVDILEMTKDLKFHNESWKIFRGLDEGNLFRFLKYAFEDLGFDPEKMLTIKKLRANIILKYPHRFYLSKNF